MYLKCDKFVLLLNEVVVLITLKREVVTICFVLFLQRYSNLKLGAQEGSQILQQIDLYARVDKVFFLQEQSFKLNLFLSCHIYAKISSIFLVISHEQYSLLLHFVRTCS